MYLKSIRIQLRCEVALMMRFRRVRAELMGMYFKSTRIHLRCELVFVMLFSRVRTELIVQLRILNKVIKACLSHALWYGILWYAMLWYVQPRARLGVSMFC